MIAVDTNVLVRLLTRDHARDASRALALFESEEIWICKTVLLETEWVLRTIYQFSAGEVVQRLQVLAGLPNVFVEDVTAVARAFDLCTRGLEFADALHLVSIGPAQSFVTFDVRFAKRSQRAGMENVSLCR